MGDDGRWRRRVACDPRAKQGWPPQGSRAEAWELWLRAVGTPGGPGWVGLVVNKVVGLGCLSMVCPHKLPLAARNTQHAAHGWA